MDHVRHTSFAGFRAVEISNGILTVVLVPEQGGRIVRLCNERTGREWCWHPTEPPKLFPVAYGSAFAEGPNLGIDECLPNIEKGVLEGKHLPCHGEIWSELWQTEVSDHRIVSQVSTRQTGLHLTRHLTWNGNTLRLDYELRGSRKNPHPYLWAFHPMLRLQPEDQLVISDSVRTIGVAAHTGVTGLDAGATYPWPAPLPHVRLDRFDLGGEQPRSIKCFVEEIPEGIASIINSGTGDSLHLEWDPCQLPHLGLWINQGGYRGWRSLAALEPTSTPSDFPSTPLATPTITTGELHRWYILLRLDS